MLEKLTMSKTSVFKSFTSVNVKELFIEPRKYQKINIMSLKYGKELRNSL